MVRPSGRAFRPFKTPEQNREKNVDGTTQMSPVRFSMCAVRFARVVGVVCCDVEAHVRILPHSGTKGKTRFMQHTACGSAPD